jgi:hypothetical protein
MFDTYGSQIKIKTSFLSKVLGVVLYREFLNDSGRHLSKRQAPPS